MKTFLISFFLYLISVILFPFLILVSFGYHFFKIGFCKTLFNKIIYWLEWEPSTEIGFLWYCKLILLINKFIINLLIICLLILVILLMFINRFILKPFKNLFLYSKIFDGKVFRFLDWIHYSINDFIDWYCHLLADYCYIKI
jgi:hypothetical protein